MADHTLPEQHRPDLTTPWWVIGALVLCFAMFGYGAKGTNTLWIDLAISNFVQLIDGRVANVVAWSGNWLGERSLAIVLLAMTLVSLALLRQRRDLRFVAIAAVGRLMAMPLKGWFDSPRPSADQVEILRVYDGLGFPSGHALTSTVVVGTAAYLVARHIQVRAVRWIALGSWIGGMALTGFARIWYGAHWFTDALGGALAGAVIVLVAASLSAVIIREESTGRRRQRPQTSAR